MTWYHKYENYKHTFYDSDGCVIIITSDKGIGIKYVQSLVNMVK